MSERSSESDRSRRRPAAPRSIGVLVDLVGSYGRGVAVGAASYAHLANWRLVTPPIWGFMGEQLHVELEAWSVDGMIAMVHDASLIEPLRAMGVPVVNVSSAIDDQPFPTVINDNGAIGRLAAEHLQSTGLRHFACFDAGPQWAHDRVAGFSEAIRVRGLEVAKPGPFGQSDARGVNLRAWLAGLPRPVGLFVSNDTWARLLLSHCHDVQLRVPEDVAIIGVDDDELVAQLTQPPISSVLTNAEQIGYRAAQLLEALLQAQPTTREVIRLPPAGVVARLSTQIAAIDDALLAAAVRFIREHADQPLDVSDVLNAIPLSRRPLEKRFRATLGRSILGEIHRVKVERAQRLLRETELTVSRIAQACGYSNASRFGVMFRKRTGETPAQHRTRARVRG